MAKRQTRRSISVRGLTYQRLANFCARAERSGSDVVEQLLAEFLDAQGEPHPTVVTPPAPKPRREPTPEEIASQHFTF